MDFEDIILYQNTKEILLKVKQQIEKDLAFCGFEYSVVDIDKLEDLLPELLDKIKSVSKNASSDIMKMINRVDLTEKQYKKVNAMEGEWALNLTKGIVLREFQKIILRQKYS